MTLTREIFFTAAYDKRAPEPSKNYGVHGVEMRWYLKGPEGAIQFVVFTNWHLPHVQQELDRKSFGEFPHLSCHPQPADLGYHSRVPRYEDQRPMDGECSVIEGGGPCYYDGSGLRADDVYRLLVEKGSEAVWQFLEEEYRSTFNVPEASHV